MRLYLTGAGGFIGTALRPVAARAGHAFVGTVAECEAVIHLAAISHRQASRRELEEVNVSLAVKTGRAAASAGVPMVFLSSVKVHGEASTAPFREESPIRPTDAYGASKARAEEKLLAVAGLQLSIIRPPLVYGPGVKANFLKLMAVIARGIPLPLASVNNRRSLIFVRNLVDAVLGCLRVQGTFLISDGEAPSTPELCRRLGAALGRPARLVPFPAYALNIIPGMHRMTRSLEVDDSAIRTALGWRPQFSLDEGLRAAAHWYLRR